jgi:hypothetical protein
MLIKNKIVSLILKNKLMAFIQKYWMPILFVAVLVYLFVDAQLKERAYRAEIKKHEKQIDSLHSVIETDLALIESLKDKDTVYIEDIKEIKLKADEKIKLVDTMSVSSMQKFYTERYSDKK